MFPENAPRPIPTTSRTAPQAHGGNHSCADGSNRVRARHHRVGGEVEPHAARMGELLQCRYSHQSVSGDRQLHRCAVAPVVTHQAQGQAMQGRGLSTLAPLRALRARTPNRAWARHAVGEGVRSCPRAGCGRAACPVRRAGCGNGVTATPLRHRQTKEAETDMCSLKPPRHISTPPSGNALARRMLLMALGGRAEEGDEADGKFKEPLELEELLELEEPLELKS